ncbi:hypothetical protein EB001_00620, partial [bacterium]|nr:hypothetical protein [bacterium]
ADKFYVAKSAANGYDSNGVRLPNSDNYNPNATVPSIASGNPTPATNSQYIAPIEADEARDMKSTTSRTVLNPNDAYGDTIANPADSAISRTYDPRTGEVVTKYAVTGPTLPAGANPGDIATGGYGAPTPNTDFYPEDYRDIANRSTKDYNLMYDPRTNDVIQVEKPTYSNYYTYDESHPPSSAVYNAYDDPTNTELKKFSSAATTFDRDYVGSTGRQNAPVPDYGPAASSGRQNLPINSEYAGEKNAEEYVKAQAAEANRPTLAYDPRTGEVVDANSITGNKKSIGTLNAVRPEVDPSTGKIGNQPITGAKQAPGTGGANGGQKTPQGSSQTGAGGKSC